MVDILASRSRAESQVRTSHEEKALLSDSCTTAHSKGDVDRVDNLNF